MTRDIPGNFNRKTNQLSLQEITELMLDYDLEVDGADEQGEGIWRLVTDRGIKCLHLVRVNQERLEFTHAVMEHLAGRGMRNGNRMIRNKHGQAYSFYGNKLGFYLTDWLPGRPCSFARTDQVQSVARLLATVHQNAEDLQIFEDTGMFGGRGDWPQKFRYRLGELRELGAAIALKQHKSKIEKLFMEHLDYYLEQGEKALGILQEPEYQEVVEYERSRGCFCLRDISSRHLMRNENELSITGFNYCLYDLRIYDLASLLRKFCTSNHWDWSKARSILHEYEAVRPLSYAERKVLLALMTFPRKFWLYSKKYFAKHDTEVEGVAERLKKAIRTEGERVEFLNGLQEYVSA